MKLRAVKATEWAVVNLNSGCCIINIMKNESFTSYLWIIRLWEDLITLQFFMKLWLNNEKKRILWINNGKTHTALRTVSKVMIFLFNVGQLYQKTVFWVRIGPQFMKFTYPTFNSVKQRQKRTFAVTLKIFFSFQMTILAGPDPAPPPLDPCLYSYNSSIF